MSMLPSGRERHENQEERSTSWVAQSCSLCTRSMLGLGSITQRAQSVALYNDVKLNIRAGICSADSTVKPSATGGCTLNGQVTQSLCLLQTYFKLFC